MSGRGTAARRAAPRPSTQSQFCAVRAWTWLRVLVVVDDEDEDEDEGIFKAFPGT